MIQKEKEFLQQYPQLTEDFTAVQKYWLERMLYNYAKQAADKAFDAGVALGANFRWAMTKEEYIKENFS